MINKVGKFALVLGLLAFLAGCSAHLGPSGLSAEKSDNPAKQPERSATLAINPTSGRPNDKLDISGSGFAPGEKALLLLTAEGLVNGKSIGTLTVGLAADESGGVVTADEKGFFKLSRRFPVNIKPGVYPLEARGDKGSQAICSLEILGK